MGSLQGSGGSTTGAGQPKLAGREPVDPTGEATGTL
jgi:hypothetical protein